MKLNEIKVYVKSSEELTGDQFKIFGNKDLYIFIGDCAKINEFIQYHQKSILEVYYEYHYRNSLMPLLDLSKVNVRIEPGAIIRNNVIFGKDAVVLMGAVINCGVSIGNKTMIDMNAVIGSGAIIGQRCHIGAGAVVAGIMEPQAIKPVEISDDVFIGANAVILEGIKIGKGAVIGAGAVVTKDVLANQTVVGVPAKPIKQKTIYKINEELRC